MTYATQAMLVKRFGERQLVQLTDRGEVPTGQIDADLVAQELANTDAVINVALDSDVMAAEITYFHPLTNDRSTAIAPADLLRFIEASGHRPVTVDLGPTATADTSMNIHPKTCQTAG